MIKNRFIDNFMPTPADVAICGSMAHIDAILKVADQLKEAGFTSHIPELSEDIDWSGFSEVEVLERKKWLIDRHIANIAVSTIVLICNYEKNGEPGYVGANTLMEMTAGYIYDKPIYIMEQPQTELNSKTLEINALGATWLPNGVEELITILSKEESNE